MDKDIYGLEHYLKNAFQLFDKNNDGKISPDELKEILGGISF